MVARNLVLKCTQKNEWKKLTFWLEIPHGHAFLLTQNGLLNILNDYIQL